MQQSSKNEQEPQLSLLEQAESYLKEFGFPYSYLENQPTIQCPLATTSSNYTVYFHMNKLETVLTLFIRLHLKVNDRRKLMVVDLLNRINRRLLFGNMFLDNEDGEICLATSHLSCTKQMTNEEVKILFMTGCNTIDDLWGPINMVAFGDMEPALAIANYKA